MRKKRILITTETFIHGGLETHIKGGIRVLSQMGHRVFLAIGVNYEEGFLPRDGVDSIYKDIFPADVTTDNILECVSRIREIIKINKIDVIYAHPFHSILPAFIAARMERIRLVVTLHGPISLTNPYLPEAYNKAISSIYKATDKVIAVSKEVSDLAKAEGIRTEVIPNSIDRRWINSSRSKHKRRFGPETRWLVVSRLDEQKVVGIKDFIEKIGSLNMGLVDVAGEGPSRNELTDWVNNSEFAGRIRFLGKRSDIHTLIQEYDAVGGMGRVVLEALASGKDVVLIGYQGVHGVVGDTIFLHKAAYANFSGRNLPLIDETELRRQLIEGSVRKEEIISTLKKEYNEDKNWRRMVYTTFRSQSKRLSKRIIYDTELTTNIDKGAPWYDDHGFKRLLEEFINSSSDMDHTEVISRFFKRIKYVIREEKTRMRQLIIRTKRSIFRDTHLSHEELMGESIKYFDKDSYTSSYRDVRVSNMDPLKHYSEFGYRENRSPGPDFNCELFLMNHPEFAESSEPLIWIYIKGVKAGKFKKSQFGRDALTMHTEAIKDSLIQDAQINKKVIYMPSMSWYDPLQQRPHHLARRLSELGVVTVYADSMVTIPKKLDDNLYLFPQNDNAWLDWLDAQGDIAKYFWLFSTSGIKFNKLQAAKKRGLQIIYDYIDDIDEDISGDITNQKETYERLPELDVAILMASAQRLFNQLKSRFSDRDVLMVKNAVNIEDFPLKHSNTDLTTVNIPNDLRSIVGKGKEVVGFYGAMAPWLDYDLINKITSLRDDLEFIFIGSNYGGALKNLTLRENVHFLGPKKYKQLHEYSRWFSCAIIPFKAGDIAKSTSPVKLFEYMAMGIPVVCTSDLEECSGYEYVYMSKDETEFNNNINKAISAKKQPKAQESLLNNASKNTWLARAKAVADALR